MIERIALDNVLPLVFVRNDYPAGADSHKSEVWRRGVTFDRGKVYMVQSSSGHGKSSLCSYIYGWRSDYQGRISFDGKDVRSLSIDDWCRLRMRSLAYLPQELLLFGELTVMDNLHIKNNLTHHRSEAWMIQALEALGIADKKGSRVDRLSLGQQQRVAVVRSLCQPFDFLLLDEPVSHLDETNNSIVAQLIREAADSQGAGIIATTVGNDIELPIDVSMKL